MTHMNHTRKVWFHCGSIYEIQGSPCMNICPGKGDMRILSSLDAVSCADVNCWDYWKTFRTPNTRTAFLMNEFWCGPLELMIAGKPCCKCGRPVLLNRFGFKLVLNKISFEIEKKILIRADEDFYDDWDGRSDENLDWTPLNKSNIYDFCSRDGFDGAGLVHWASWKLCRTIYMESPSFPFPLYVFGGVKLKL